jgi:hypothetical protein
MAGGESRINRTLRWVGIFHLLQNDIFNYQMAIEERAAKLLAEQNAFLSRMIVDDTSWWCLSKVNARLSNFYSLLTNLSTAAIQGKMAGSGSTSEDNILSVPTLGTLRYLDLHLEIDLLRQYSHNGSYYHSKYSRPTVEGVVDLVTKRG